MFSKSEPRNKDAVSGRTYIAGGRICDCVPASRSEQCEKICRLGLPVKLVVRLYKCKICLCTIALIGHILTSRGKARQTARSGNEFTLVFPDSAVLVGPCHHGIARPQVADRGTASDKEGSCE